MGNSVEGRELKKVFIHLGHGKTGTTSIQDFLKEASELPECPFLYPTTCLSGRQMIAHHDLHRAGFGEGSPWNAGEDEQMCQELLAEINNSQKSTVIISSEAGLPTLRLRKRESIKSQIRLLDSLSVQHHVSIVYYVRNQLEAVESAYYTNCMINKEQPSLQGLSAYLSTAGAQFDYWQNISEIWAKYANLGNLLTKVYHKSLLAEGDSVIDFLTMTGIWDNGIRIAQAKKSRLNTTAAYNMPGSRGLLINNKIRSEIINAFRQSNLAFSDSFLDSVNASHLLKGFI